MQKNGLNKNDVDNIKSRNTEIVESDSHQNNIFVTKSNHNLSQYAKNTLNKIIKERAQESKE